MRPTLILLLAVLLGSCQKEQDVPAAPADPADSTLVVPSPPPPDTPQGPPVDTIPDAIEAILGVYHGVFTHYNVTHLDGVTTQTTSPHADTLLVSFVPPDRLFIGHPPSTTFFLMSGASTVYYDSTTHRANGGSLGNGGTAYFFPEKDSLYATQSVGWGDGLNGAWDQHEFKGTK